MPKAKTKSSAGNRSNNHQDRDQVMRWYREMLLQRRFEEKSNEMYMKQKIRGFLHLYIGQEAISSGIESAIRKDDQIITAYRDHGFAITRGLSPDKVMAEMFGKIGGSSKGRGGSMHMFSKEHNLFGGHGIVGAHIPLGAGIAFANKYKGQDNLCVCLMGDGAIRQGSFHEALNLAMTWTLPVIYIIENNRYAMGTSVERTSNVTDLYKLACGFDMPSWQIDAMDVFEVHEQVGKAVAHVRSGKGPVLLEALTYRYKGHSMSDPAKYRTKDELEHYKDEDPIIKLKHHIVNNKMATNADLDSIENEIAEIVAKSVEFAENSPFPQPGDLYEDVYHDRDYPFLRE